MLFYGELILKRRVWTLIHTWAGIGASLLLVFVLITGTLAVVSQDIDWLTNPVLRVEDGQRSDNIAWVSAYEHLLQRYPERKINQLMAPYDAHFNAQAIVKVEGQLQQRIYFSPRRGELVGAANWYNWQRFFRQTHRHLMLPLQLGVPLVSLTALLLLALMASGLVMFRGWYKGWFHWPKQGKAISDKLSPEKRSRVSRRQSYRYWGDWHRLLGLWLLPFVLLILLTGLWYLIESLGGRASYPDVVKVSGNEQVVTVSPDTLARVLAQVKLSNPHMQINRIIFPRSEVSPLLIQGQTGALLVRDRSSHLAFEPVTGDLLQQRIPEQLSWYARISEAVDPLHFGTFAGTKVRWIWFVMGLMLTILSLCGTYLYASKALLNQPQRNGIWECFAHCWYAMGWLRWPIALICLYAVVSAVSLSLS